MNKRIEIQLILRPDCKLIAVDNENYCDWEINLTKYKMIEFLVYNEDKDIIPETLKILQEKYARAHFSSKYATEFILKKDGTYIYHKMIIPTLELFQSDSNLYSNLYQQLYFEGDKLYFSKLEDNNIYSYDDVKNNREEITNYLTAYNIINNNQASQSLYCPAKYLFSICKLQRCLVSLQKKLIMNSCSFDICDRDKTLRNRRDFLLSAVYVFDYLKDIKNFTEAQRLLDNLSTCNNICEEDLTNSFNDCNCGSTL